MFKDIIIGQYVPGNSPLHKMNPPVKIIMTILYIVLLFILKNPISYVVFTIYTITLILISGVPFKMILKGLKPMLWIFIFTAVLNVFMTPGDTVWALKIFKFTLKITKEGIESGSLMVIRLLYLVMGTSLLTLTTSPLQLTDGIEKLLKPFNKIKVPSLPEQTKIADFLSLFDEKIYIEKQTLEHLKELKKGLLQQMFV